MPSHAAHAASSPLVESFLEMMAAERGAAKNTLDSYRRDLDVFVAFLARRGRAVAAAAPADITAFMREASESGLAASSRARRLSTLRQLYRFLAFENHSGGWPIFDGSGRVATLDLRVKLDRTKPDLEPGQPYKWRISNQFDNRRDRM